MFKFLGFGRGARSSDHLKDKQGKDLFEFSKAIEHGFPPKSSAIAHDPALRLLAIGTSTGVLKIYGRPGVELSARHSKETVIQELHFLPEQGRVISVCDDGEQNTIHLWEVNKRNGKSVLEEVKTCTLEGRLKKISVCRLSMSTNRLYLGTEGGNIYLLDINSFELQEYVIYQDVVMQSVSDENKSNAGSVEAIQEHPSDSNKILIGYRKGLTVLWEHGSCSVRQTFLVSQELQGVAWYPDGDKFVSAHADGSLNVWSVGEEEMNRDSNTPFGPFPCKAITKIELSNNLLFFAGGMPRASYGDKHCISVMKDSTIQVVFDFTSHVLDFFTIGEEDSHFLAVLCEQEFVLIDLSGKDKGYPTFVKPYLACLHSSPITSSHHCHDCPAELWDKITAAGQDQMTDEHSSKDWPITGGKTICEEADTRNLLVTGHEDGSVNFWDVSHEGMALLYAVQTSKFFVGDHEAHDSEPQEGEEDAWPPFKKVGKFDPCSDDPRYAVTKVSLCTKTNVLTVAGNGGQVLIFDISDESSEVELEITEIDFVADKENFQWKGHGPLLPKEGKISSPKGFKPRMGLQLTPAAPITALAVHSDWGLVAVGTVHGVIMFDYLNKKTITTKWTVVEGESATGEHLSRKKSLKQSIRNSIRRLRRSRKGSSPKKRGEGGEGEEAAAQATSPVSRLVNENRVEEDVMSMVRCLYFVDTYLRDAATRSASLWAGTNSGHIYVFYINVPDDRSAGEVSGELGKEIKLKHKAPVVSIFVVDKDGVPLAQTCADDGEKGPDLSGQHSLVICSEEQFKTFTLPHLKPRTKEKLTAIDGSRVRKIGLINVTSKNDEPGVVYHCLACLSNQGDLSVYSIPRLKLQLKASCLKKEDVSGISSLVFTSNGQGFYLSSNSEMQRFSLTISEPLERDCILELAEGMRPAEPEPALAAEVELEVEAEKKSRSSSSSSSSSDSKKEEKKGEEEENKGEEEEEKKEEEEEKEKEAPKEKEEDEAAKQDDMLEISEVTTIVKTEPLEEGESSTKVFSQTRTVVSESHSYTKQTSGSEEVPDLSELTLDAATSETTSYSVSSSRVVTQKTVITSSSTSEHVITSEGLAIENGDMEQEPEVSDSGDGKKRGKGFKSPGKLFSKKDTDESVAAEA